ncbi:MAG: hypothetical protein PHD33_01080 [Atribacterota bacterium]|nr:hypothetical protein [Atribacterota bacterium]
MKKWPYIFVLLLILVISVFIFWRIISSPQYSLQQLDKSISEQDVRSFQKYLDLDNFVDGIIVQAWQYYTSPEEKNDNTWDKIRNEITGSLLSVIKPNIKEIIKGEIINYVSTGNWQNASSEEENSISSFIIKIIKERIDPGKWDHQTINYANIKNDQAEVGLTYYDEKNDVNFLVEINMVNMGNYWQVVEITNIAQLIRFFQFL